MNNAIYLRRRSKIALPSQRQLTELPPAYVTTLSKNLESLGYCLSEALFGEMRRLSLGELEGVYNDLVEACKRARGAHWAFTPMYPNFPGQVMGMSRAELYLNAIVHYWTNGTWLPSTDKKARAPVRGAIVLQSINLGSEDDFLSIFGHIAGSNTSLSAQDVEDLKWFVEHYRDEILTMLPSSIPQKENAAHVCGLLLGNVDGAAEIVGNLCKTATDVLRIAVAMSGGDVSLAESTKFRAFTRAERCLLLGLVDRLPSPTEDMLRWKERWKRLGERLHPGEYAKRFPTVNESFKVLRRDRRFERFNLYVEEALAEGRVQAAVAQLASRPGDFARRLDHLLRLDPSMVSSVLAVFGKVARDVSTPVLLQVMTHFRRRGEPSNLRVFFPKGAAAKAQAVEYNLPELAEGVANRVVEMCEATLRHRFSSLPPLGRVYVDPGLANYLIPFSQRSASKALRTIVRGSRVGLPAADTLRFFIWWKDGKERTDLDLSAVFFDKDFGHLGEIAYYNIKDLGAHHSGDIVSAPDGASEFIDVSTELLKKRGAAYVVMVVNSYTTQPYCDLPECFAGWMAREHPNSGEIFEPKTVQDRFDLTANSRIAMPILFDLERREAVWCDLSLKGNPRWVNNVAANRGGIQIGLRAMCALRKTSIYDLMMLHAQSRGSLVPTREEADVVFSVDTGTPFELETIASQFMA